MDDARRAPRWAADAVSILSASGPLPAWRLAELVAAAPAMVEQFLQDEPRAVLTGEGWVDGLRLAEGVAVLHELSEVEADTGVLAADAELALFAQLASAGLALCGAGEDGVVRARALPELPLRLRDAAASAGQGLVGQALVGPSGWLGGFAAGDLLTVRLDGGVLEVTAASPPTPADSARAAAVAAACASSAGEAVRRFGDGQGEQPAAALPGVLAGLLVTARQLWAGPLPPLQRWLRLAGCEAFGGYVGLRGVAWNRGSVRGLSRVEEADATFALAGLLAAAAAADADAGARGVVEPAQSLELMSTSVGVLAHVAGEVERRTAVEGVDFTAALARLRAAAVDVAAWRAAVAMLSARAAEGAGDCQSAEREVHRALADWPDLQPALMDAGEYAACRGDLRAADTYLRHADDPVAEALRGPVRSLLAGTFPPAVGPAGAGAGRNQPCPCGSGRKRKVCCLSTAAGYPLAARVELLYALLNTFVQRAPATERLGMLISRSGRNIQAAMLCLDALLACEGFTQRFLRARGGWLRADERALVQEWAKIPIVTYEVRQVREGNGVTVRTPPDGGPVFLRDRSFSTSVRRLDLFCGRLLSDGSRPRLLSLPAPVDRSRRRELLELLAAAPSAGQIAEFFGPQPEPHLRNSDGHDYFDAEVSLEVPDPVAAWLQLTAETNLVEIDPGNRLDVQVVVGGRTTSRGTISREGRRLVLWANSRQRLAELEQRVRTAVPAAQEVGRRTERVGSEPPDGDRRVRTLVIDNEVVFVDPNMTEEAAYENTVRQRSRSWVDTANDLDMTPREAATAGAATRAEIEALLDDIQWRNDRLVAQGQPMLMDAAWIRGELGLPAGR